MGRKKAIETEIVLQLIEKYWDEECGGNPNKLKGSQIGDYVRSHGYPSVSDKVLRTIPEISALKNQLIEESKDSDAVQIASYVTLNISDFIENNLSKSALTRSLTELDQYYKKLADSAGRAFEREKAARRSEEVLQQRVQELSASEKVKLDQIDSLTKETSSLKEENSKLRKLIDTYVYPEIANEFLKKSGLLQKTAGAISPDAMEHDTIKADSNIEFEDSIIRGMFNNFEE